MKISTEFEIFMREYIYQRDRINNENDEDKDDEVNDLFIETLSIELYKRREEMIEWNND